MVTGCALFTNGLEWVGKKRGWSHGVVGSVLASIGTALPETAIPLVAILVVGSSRAKEIGIGAILGAPFALSTIALALTGAAALRYAAKNKTLPPASSAILRQDLVWFFAAFSLALLCSYIRPVWFRIPPALLLVVAYGVHIKGHFRELRAEEPDPPSLYFAPRRPHPRLILCAGQALVGLVFILLVAHFFVGRVEALSLSLGAAPALLSLFISPLASELPEIVNSTLWMRQGRGTLALGNITGAILFQGTVLAALGMTLTPWLLGSQLALAGMLSLAAALFAIFALRRENVPPILLLSGGFYLAYLLFVLH